MDSFLVGEHWATAPEALLPAPISSPVQSWVGDVCDLGGLRILDVVRECLDRVNMGR